MCSLSTASSLLSQLHRFVSVNKLKYFFAVDTAYVAKKLGLLVFPYTHQVSCLPGELVGPCASCVPSQSLAPRPQPPSFFSFHLFLLTWLLLPPPELGGAVQSRCASATTTRSQRP